MGAQDQERGDREEQPRGKPGPAGIPAAKVGAPLKKSVPATVVVASVRRSNPRWTSGCSACRNRKPLQRRRGAAGSGGTGAGVGGRRGVSNGDQAIESWARRGLATATPSGRTGPPSRSA